jgi:hypothetical protein
LFIVVDDIVSIDLPYHRHEQQLLLFVDDDDFSSCWSVVYRISCQSSLEGGGLLELRNISNTNLFGVERRLVYYVLINCVIFSSPRFTILGGGNFSHTPFRRMHLRSNKKNVLFSGFSRQLTTLKSNE